MQTGSLKKRHRSTPACARCYKLKQKCDRGTPRCLRCVGAGVNCTALNRETSVEVPRSPIQYLEQRLAELQRIHSQVNSGNDGNCPDPNALDIEHAKVVEFAAVAIANHTTSSLLMPHAILQHGAKLFYPSERPPLKIPVHGIYHDIYPRTAGREYAAQFSRFNGRKIPLDVAKRLFDNYKDNVLPRFPCFLEADLTRHFDKFYSQETNQPNTTIFVVTLILAISSLTSKRHDFRKVAALSEALHADAMRHIDFLRDSSITSLQSLLLLIQTAILLPHTANLWYISGEAMRMAIALGLHQEPDRSIVSNPILAELRRRLFWVTYQLERVVAISCGCPVAISDEHITTQLPFNGGHSRANLDSFLKSLPHALEEKQFLIHTRFCLMQTEIHTVQFFDQPIPGQEADHNNWVQKMKESIHVLFMHATSEGIVNPWLMSTIHQCQVLLHRPCSRDMAVSESSLIEVTTASVQLINTSLKTALAGGFVFTFELANCAFQAGMVLLYALRNHALELQQVNLVDISNDALENLCRLFDTLSAKWPALSDTGRYIKEMIDTNLRNPIGNLGSEYDMGVLEELDFLVTQRRIHSIYHRNLPNPTNQNGLPQLEALNQISPGFLEEESWWRDFINHDFDMFDRYDLPDPTGSFTIATLEQPLEQNLQSPKNQRQSTRPTTDLDEVIDALPACSFCRDRRIKCHRQLPACKECQRTGRDCVFFDPVLSENIPLKQVYFLSEKIKELTARSVTYPTAPNPSEGIYSQRIILLPIELQLSPSGTCDENEQLCRTSTSFFGPWSLLGCLRTQLQATPNWEIPWSLQEAGRSNNYNCIDFLSPNTDLPPRSVTLSLIDLFARSANTFFPILDQPSLATIASRDYGDDHSNFHDSHGVRELVIAIASLIAKRNNLRLGSWASSSFNLAIERLDSTCDHSSWSNNIKLLQRTLLICVYLLLSPQSGDIWRHLGFAIRLFFDLSHRPSEDEEEDHHLFCTLTRTLYCLESQVSIAFSRPTLLLIGDSLRDELAQPTTGSFEEHISIFFYLVSFHKMKIHCALLRNDSDIANLNRPQNDSDSGHQDLRRNLDEWFVRWKELIASMPENQVKGELASWGELNYYQGLFMISMIWPTPGGQAVNLCNSISKACIKMTRHQQLFAQLNSDADKIKLPAIFPMNWTTSHLISQVGLHLVSQLGQNPDRKLEEVTSLSKCLLALSSLETDPGNLVTGQAMVLEELCRMKGTRF